MMQKDDTNSCERAIVTKVIAKKLIFKERQVGFIEENSFLVERKGKKRTVKRDRLVF